MINYKRTFLLMLSGVQLKDLHGDEIFDDRFLEAGNMQQDFVADVYGDDKISSGLTSNYDNSKNFDNIPKKFISLEKWPSSTNLKCWECCSYFTSSPTFIPKTMHEEAYGVVAYDIEGNFCTWNCAAKFARAKYPKTHLKYKEYMIYIYKLVTGKSIIDIDDPPCRTSINEYCGPDGISVEQFEELKKNCLKMTME